jgi:chromate transporter
VWHNLKKYAVIYRSLEGINAAVVGIMIGAILYLLKDVCLMPILQTKLDGWISIVIAIATFLMLQKTKLPAPFIVITCLVVGWLI